MFEGLEVDAGTGGVNDETIRLVDMKRVCRSRTWLFIAMQGVWGCFPWSSFSFLILWFERMELSDLGGAPQKKWGQKRGQYLAYYLKGIRPDVRGFKPPDRNRRTVRKIKNTVFTFTFTSLTFEKCQAPSPSYGVCDNFCV